MKRPLLLLIVLVISLLALEFGGIAVASEGQSDSLPAKAWGASFDIAAGDNPATLAIVGEAQYRNVYRLDNSPLWDGLYTQGGFQFSVTPAFGRAGAHLEWLPIAILQLRLQYDRYAFFGQHGSLLSYASGDEPFGDDVIKARKGEEKTDTANRILLQPTLRLKFGPYILRNKSEIALFEFDGKGPYYHEWEYDTLLKTSDRLFFNQLMLLYEVIKNEKGKTLLLGPFHEYLRTSHAGLERTRVGLSAYFVPKNKFLSFNRPRLWVQAGRYLKDRNRDDEFYFLAGVGADLSLK